MAAVRRAVRPSSLAAAWRAARPGGSSEGVQAVRVWLGQQTGPDLTTAVADVLGGLRADAMTVGEHAALTALGQHPESLDGWKPGEPSTVERGVAAQLLGSPQEDAGRIAGHLLDDAATALTEASPDATVDQLAKAVDEAVTDPQRAERITVTETTHAVNATARAVYQQHHVVAFRWQTEEDDRVCPTCEGNETASPLPFGQAFPSGHLHPPAHPRCFPAGVVVTGPSAVAATARRYEGDLVTIVFADGQEVPVTPNHPVLTPDGWVAAGDLHEGADLLRAVDADAVARLVCPDDRQAVSRIEDVAGAFRESGPVGSALMPVASEDFHGDGAGDDEVQVVWPARFAERHVVAELGEQRGQVGFESAAGQAPLALCDPDSFAERGSSSVGRLVGRCEHGLLLVDGGALPSERHRRGAVTAVDAEFREHAVDGIPVDSVTAGKRLDRLAGQEVLGEVVRGGDDASAGAPRLGASPERDAAGDEPRPEGLASEAAEGRALADRLAGQVELDRVAELRRIADWSGHVYNLETVEGWYFANGIIAHNCRCALLPEAF